MQHTMLNNKHPKDNMFFPSFDKSEAAIMFQFGSLMS